MPESIRTVVVFALSTGLRRSNILDLEWLQVDMQRKVAWISPENAKAGKAIGVALNDSACKVLKGQIGKYSRWVFVHTKAAPRRLLYVKCGVMIIAHGGSDLNGLV